MKTYLVWLALMSGSLAAAEITPTYHPEWPYKVTQHTTENHQVCDATNPQSCGCDHVIDTTTNSGKIKIKAAQTFPQAGEKVCIVGGTYTAAEVYDVHGTEAAPIIITNIGGQVVINDEMQVKLSTHLKFMGDGDNNVLYGIKVTGKPQSNTASGLTLKQFTRDVEIAYLDLSSPLGRTALHFNSGRPSTDNDGNYVPMIDPTTGEVFVQTNSIIHHSFFHDSFEGEGIYLGLAYCNADELNNGGALENTYVYDNIVKDIGADGIQVGCSRKNTVIANNYIEHVGYNPFRPNAGHTKGFQLGQGTTGVAYNNYLTDIESDCFFLNAGPTDIPGRDYAFSIYNNIGLQCDAGVAFHSRIQDVIDAGQKFAVAHNTFVDMKTSHYWINGQHDDIVQIDLKNNFYVDTGDAIPHIAVNGPNNVGSNFDELNRMDASSLEEAGFVDATSGDFNLLPTSIAALNGIDASDLDVVVDIANRQRTNYNPGATELEGEPTPPDTDYLRSLVYHANSNGKGLLRYYAGENEAQNRVDILSDGHNTLEFDVQLADGMINLTSLEVQITASRQTQLVPLANYMTALNNDVNAIVIPLSDFLFGAGKLEGGVYEVGIKAASDVGDGSFNVDEVRFTGGTDDLIWYGDDYRSEAIFNSNPGKLYIEEKEEVYVPPPVDEYFLQFDAGSNGRAYLTQDVAYDINAAGHTTLTFDIRALSPSVSLASLNIGMKAGGQRSELPMNAYLPDLTSDYQRVSIPIADFAFLPEKLNVGIFEVGFKTTSAIGDASFVVDNIELSGGSTPYLWYGETRRGNAQAGSLYITNPSGFTVIETYNP